MRTFLSCTLQILCEVRGHVTRTKCVSIALYSSKGRKENSRDLDLDGILKESYANRGTGFIWLRMWYFKLSGTLRNFRFPRKSVTDQIIVWHVRSYFSNCLVIMFSRHNVHITCSSFSCETASYIKYLSIGTWLNPLKPSGHYMYHPL
jgi:hypothetical protein